MKTPIAYEITADTYQACRRKLETVPMDQWPSPEIYHRVYIGVRLYEMEQAEKDDAEHICRGSGAPEQHRASRALP